MSPDGAFPPYFASDTHSPVRPEGPPRIAIVGSGIAGLGAAWLLNRVADITVFEAGDYVGGHSNTVDVEVAGQSVAVDTGFIVYNERNYPNLTRLFEAIDAPTEASVMSFAVSAEAGRFEYRGSTRGLFLEKPGNLLSTRIWRLARDVVRFYRSAPALLAEADERLTLGDCLKAGGYSNEFVHQHILPMGAAVWSTSPARMLDFPALSFLRFCANHALFELRGRPRWRTVSGGSREYVRRLAAPFRHRIHLDRGVAGVQRTAGGVLVRDVHGRTERFDQIVLACHADQALRILGVDADAEEARTLGAFGYEPNEAILHTDRRLLPNSRTLWASWNYMMPDGTAAGGDPETAASVSYWMNRLQNLKTREPLIVSLNPNRAPDPDKVLRRFVYDHPSFDRSALAAQARLPLIQGRRRSWFCGSYTGYGFHEDGLASGLAVAAALGAPAPWRGAFEEMSPAAAAATPVPGASAPVGLAAA